MHGSVCWACKGIEFSPSSWLYWGLITQSLQTPEHCAMVYLRAVRSAPGLVRLEQAENTLLRPELVNICKDAISKELDDEASYCQSVTCLSIFWSCDHNLCTNHVSRVSTTQRDLEGNRNYGMDWLHSSIRILNHRCQLKRIIYLSVLDQEIRWMPYCVP